jgi:acid phosphatase family membrane protein YuiD
MKHLPAALIIAVIVQVICQVFKTVFYSIRDGKLTLSYLTTTGGFPSAHSAFVTALAVSIGIRSGFTTDLFAVSAVLAIIVMYDAIRVRMAVEQHARLLNRLVEKYHPEEKADLNEMIGHSVLQILAGIATGGILGALLTLFVFKM